MQHTDIVTTVERLTGVRIDGTDLRGRNVWGRIAFNREGAIHIEILAKDRQVNDVVMASIRDEDTPSDTHARYKAYCSRCKQAAKAMNEKAIKEHGLILLVANNGHLTQEAKSILHAIS